VITTNDSSQLVETLLLEETQVCCCGLDARILGMRLLLFLPSSQFSLYMGMRSNLIPQTPGHHGPLTSSSVRMYASEKRAFTYKWADVVVSELFVVQSLSCVQLFATPWTAALQASLSFTISQSLPKFKSIKSISDAIQLSYLLPLPSPFAFSLSQHQDLFQ